MTRDEAEKLTADAQDALNEDRASWAQNGVIFNELHFKALLALARLGLRVECPSEEDVERMAKAIHDADDTTHTVWPEGPDDTGQRDVDCWVRLCLNCDVHRAEARAALAALKGG